MEYTGWSYYRWRREGRRGLTIRLYKKAEELVDTRLWATPITVTETFAVRESMREVREFELRLKGEIVQTYATEKAAKEHGRKLGEAHKIFP